MEDYKTMHLDEIKNNFATDKQCREYLAKLRWKKGYMCPKCKSKDYWLTSEYKFKCQQCGHKLSVTSGTLFQDSHVSLPKWFLAIWHYTEDRKINVPFLQKELNLGSNNTAYRMLNLIQKANTMNHIDVFENELKIIDFEEVSLEEQTFVTAIWEIKNNQIGRVCILKTDTETGESTYRHAKYYTPKENDIIENEHILWKCFTIKDGSENYNQLIEELKTNKMFKSDKLRPAVSNLKMDELIEEAVKAKKWSTRKHDLSFEEIIENAMNI